MSTSRRLRRAAGRAGGIVVTAGVLAFFGAGIASAHVTAHSTDQLTKGGTAEITFRVPAEEPTAGTVKLQVNFPLNTPIGDVATKPVPGWTAQVAMTHLATPVRMAKETITDAVQSVTWTAQPGTSIAPGEFQEFSVVVEGLPTNTDELVMPAVQTYDNGDVVNWTAPPPAAGAAKPEHPAPHVALADATGTDTASGVASPPAEDSTARWLGGAGVVVGALALGFGAGALARSRRGTGGGDADPRDPA